MVMNNEARFAKMLGATYGLPDPKKAGTVLALAYPERIMQPRGGIDGDHASIS